MDKFNQKERWLIVSVLIVSSPVWVGAIVGGLAWIYTKLN